ncbi:flowering time control protein FCA [Euphorbia lathyris]|uniref:flowering time control protein FCA n=1 Tax=Euphorbia lathyris TaxID=212925 RepID=UPI0033142C10
MDRHRGERYGGAGGGAGAAINTSNNNSYNQDSYHSRRPSRFSDGPPPRFSDTPMNRFSNNGTDTGNNFDHSSPNEFRGGAGGGRGFESSPRHTPPVGSGGGIGGFGPPGGVGTGGLGGFRPMGGRGAGFGPNFQAPSPLAPPPPQPLSGQKRGYPFSARETSPDSDSGSFAKLFVGSVPRTANEEDIRPVFELHGTVLEVALIKDKRTGQQQGCCFVKYATPEAADRAIRALHNQHTIPGGVGPIQVRYADGERERLGAVEYKLFVGSLNKQATEKEVEEVFSPYGHVEDVYLMRDEMKQSRGCGFVKYSHKEMALSAINSLNGTYKMIGCDQPLTVRFADPKRPRAGESRGPPGPAFGGPGFGPRFQAPGQQRPPPNFGEPMGDRPPPNAWRPISPQNMGPSPNIRGFGNQVPNRPVDLATPLNQGFNQPLQVPPVNQQISPLQKPVNSPQNLPPLQPHHQVTSHAGQLQTHPTANQTPFSQAPPSQQYQGMGGHLSASQPHLLQQTKSSAMPQQAPSNMNAPSHLAPGITNQPQMPVPVQQQHLQPLQQSPSPLAQMLSQQTQTLQATFQSSQQTFSQLQQQMQMMQPSNQNLALQQNSQPTKQQWPGIAAQTVASTPTTLASDVTSTTSSAPVTTGMAQSVAPVKFTWTEHTSPEGFKYYYNSITRESRWEKPEELKSFEQPAPSQQLQQKPPLQQPQNQLNPQAMPQNQLNPQAMSQNQLNPQAMSQNQLNPQAMPTPQGPQAQQMHLQAQFQTQFRHPQPQQQPLFPSSYAASGGRIPQDAQGLHAAQEWMWKNKAAGSGT